MVASALKKNVLWLSLEFEDYRVNARWQTRVLANMATSKAGALNNSESSHLISSFPV